jgi:poly-gamma-glutamate capsule biosynthesis protein CapA/YwtB (metallophosphatase superfamily)
VFDRISFFLAGDAFQPRCIGVYGGVEDVAPLFDRLRAADVGFVNLEITIHDFEGYPVGGEKRDAYGQADPSVALDLRRMGFDMVSCANNHAMDYSAGGLEATVRHLDEAGIVHAGAGVDLAEAREPAYLETSKGTVALVSATTWGLGSAGHSREGVRGRPGVNPLRLETVYHLKDEDWERVTRLAGSLGLLPEDHDEGFDFPVRGHRFVPGDRTRRELEPNPLDLSGNLKAVQDARRLGDWVVFSLHDHYSPLRAREGFRRNQVPTRAAEELAHEVVDAGADIVAGHGPHVLRGIEIYRGRPIFYSLGNWVFQSTLCRRQPSDIFEQWGLTAEHTVADLYERREEPPSRFFKDPAYWESVVAEVALERGGVSEIRLVPVHLDYDPEKPLSEQRTRAGIPHLATGERAERIIEEVARLSRPYGTEIESRDAVGHVVL